MTDFKKGDFVEYVGPSENIKAYGTLTVSGEHGMTGRISVEEVSWAAIVPENIRHVTPAPDVITIDRAELPEVVERDGKFWAGSGPEECMASGSENPNWLRNHAKSALALAEFLAAREKAEQEAADQHAAILNKRRDELAVEVAKAAGFIDFKDFTYKEHLPSAQAAINMLIERDGKVKK